MLEKFAIRYIFHDTEAASHPVQMEGRFPRAYSEDPDGEPLILSPATENNTLTQKGQKAALVLEESLGQSICLALRARAVDAH